MVYPLACRAGAEVVESGIQGNAFIKAMSNTFEALRPLEREIYSFAYPVMQVVPIAVYRGRYQIEERDIGLTI